MRTRIPQQEEELMKLDQAMADLGLMEINGG